MADDLKETIAIEGAEEAKRQLEDMGKAGEDAFAKIGDAATGAAKGVNDAGKAIGTALQNVSNAGAKVDTGKRLAEIGDAAKGLGSSLRSAVGSVVSFYKGLGTAGIAATAAAGTVIGLAKHVYNVANASSQAAADTKELGGETKKTYTQMVRLNLQAAETQRKLNQDFATGKITAEDYTEGLIELQRSTALQAKELRIMADAEADFNSQMEKENKRRQDAVALSQLQDKFGVQATNSLLNLGRAVEEVRKSFVQTFSPVLAGIADSITRIFNENRPQILKFFSDLKAAAIPVVEDIGAAFITLAPAVVSVTRMIYNTVMSLVVPAFKTFLIALQAVADFFNKFFGTDFTAQQLIIIGLIIQFSGALKILTSTVSVFTGTLRLLATVFGGWQIALAAVAIAVGYLIAKFLLAQDWAAIWDSIAKKVTGTFDKVRTYLAGVWTDIVQAATAVWAAIANTADAGIARIVTGWTTLTAFVNDGLTAIKGFAQSVWDGLASGADFVANAITMAFQSVKTKAIEYFTAIRDYVNAVWENIKSKFGAIFGETATDAGGLRRASGGMIYGPGGPTDDKVPLWGSNGEFMMRAAAVRQYGVDFMHAINRGLLNVDIPRFAEGGLIGAVPVMPTLRLAEGGPVSKSRNVLNLTIGGETFTNLLAADDTMDRLSKFATKKKITSGGRKPAWFK